MLGPPSDVAAPVLGRASAYLTALDRRAYAWTIAAFCAVVLATRLWPGQVAFPLNLFEAYAAYAMIPVWGALLYAGIRGLRELTAVCLFLALAHTGWALDPLLRVSSGRACTDGERRLRLLTANLLAPAPSDAFAEEIAAVDADVVITSELSDVWSALLAEHGLYARYPHVRAQIIPVTESYFGIGVLSRAPIVDHAFAHVDGIPMLRVDVEIDGAPLRIHAFHAHPPTDAFALVLWEQQLATLGALAEADVAAGRSVVVAGDFNTTTMTRGYRGLLDRGLTPAHDAALHPFATTWPNGIWLFPPVRIDHVLTHGLGVRSVWEGVGEGSDHRPIVSDLCVPMR